MKTVEMPVWTFDNGWVCPHCGCKHHYYRVEDGPMIVGANASFEKCYNCGHIYPIFINPIFINGKGEKDAMHN